MSDATADLRPLPVGTIGRASVGWWGMLCVIATESTLFAYLLFGYFYYAVQLAGNWLPQRMPSMRLSLPAIVLLIASSIAVWWGERGVRQGRRGRLLAGVAVTFVLGVIFVALQVLDWDHEPISLRSGVYGSVFFTLTGLHVAHLLVGLVALLLVMAWSGLGYFDATRNAPVLIVAAYWHFVVLVGVVVFVALYLMPYLW